MGHHPAGQHWLPPEESFGWILLNEGKCSMTQEAGNKTALHWIISIWEYTCNERKGNWVTVRAHSSSGKTSHLWPPYCKLHEGKSVFYILYLSSDSLNLISVVDNSCFVFFIHRSSVNVHENSWLWPPFAAACFVWMSVPFPLLLLLSRCLLLLFSTVGVSNATSRNGGALL